MFSNKRIRYRSLYILQAAESLAGVFIFRFTT